MNLLGWARPAAALLSQRKRRVWANGERAHIELRRVESGAWEAYGAAVEEGLADLPAVLWVEANPFLGRVVVGFDRTGRGVEDLTATLDGIEGELGLGSLPLAGTVVPHPGDIEPLVREAVKLSADALGVTLSVTSRLIPAIPLPVRRVAGTVTAVVNGVPKVRQAIESRVAGPLPDMVLSVSHALAQGLGQSPLGPLSDAFHHGTNLTAAAARRQAWRRAEPGLFRKPSFGPVAVLPPPRPGPLPAGPVERFCDQAWTLSLGAAGAALLATRSPIRAGALLEAGVPKAARFGKEAFCTGLERGLSGRDVVILDPMALRALDRVDCLVVQEEIIFSDDVAPGPPTLVADSDAAEVRAVVRRLLDPEAPTATAQDGKWKLTPFRTLRIPVSGGARRAAESLGAGGADVLALVHGRRVVALTALRRSLRPEADDLLALARAAHLEVVIATPEPEAPSPLEGCAAVRDGPELAASVRALQQAGHVVLLVAATQPTALAASDCGVGLFRPDGPPPWGAHLICRQDLVDACFVLEAVAEARAVSRWSARTATFGAGAAALLALRPLPGAGLRAGTAVNSAALVTILHGTRSAQSLCNRTRPFPRDPTPWHTLDGGAVLRHLGSSLEGLASTEARHRRLEPPAPLPPTLELGRDVLEELFNPLTPILGVGIGLSLLGGAAADAVMIGGVLVLNAAVGGVQRFRADQAFSALEKTDRRRAAVRRPGSTEEEVIDAELLVPGDVVQFRAGDAVPADCRILAAEWLEVDESSLTGESLPVPKDPAPSHAPTLADRASMLYDGSSIAVGDALAVVVATGAATEARRAVLAGGEPPRTGVEARLEGLTRLTMPIAAGSGLAMVASGLLRGEPFGQLASSAVSLAVAAVPEGLPLLSNVAQLSAARRLAARGVLVRNAKAVEALGRVEFMCVDKTGTVTEGRLRLALVATADAEEPPDALSDAGRSILAAGLRATPAPPEHGRLPHPTDAAVVAGAARAGVGVDGRGPRWSRHGEMPFEPSRGYHVTLGRSHGYLLLSVKGAPEVVLPRCARWADADGLEQRLDDEARTRVAAQLHQLTRRGLRVLCVAERRASDRANINDERVRNLTLLGFLALADPVRPTAAAAVRDLRAAGVEVMMITGDHPSTAEGIAAELGLLDGAERTITGAELDELDDDALTARLAEVRIFARVTPTHKVRIVRALQRAGRVVAMTGDGANDAPAIRLADVGIALGQRSTSAARDAADLVVLDDRIEVLVEAVAEGRGMWVSVRDAVALLVGGNLGEIGFTLGGALLAGQAPINARQLLLVNLLTDVAPAMAIASQPPARRSFAELLREGPEASLGSPLNHAILWRAACTGVAATGAWWAGRVTGPPARARTIGLVGLVGAQLGQTLVAGRPSRTTVLSVIGSGLLLVGIVQTPGVSRVFGCTPLDPVGWLIGGVAAGGATAGSVLIPRLATAVRPRQVTVGVSENSC